MMKQQPTSDGEERMATRGCKANTRRKHDKDDQGRERKNSDLRPGLAVMEERLVVDAEASSKLSERGGLNPLHGGRPVPKVH